MSPSLRQNKGFMTLMAAQVISNLGDWLSIVAIITLVGLKWEATPMNMSLVILSLAVPMAVLGPITGTIADRFERKRLMIASDIIRGCVFLLMTLATNVWMVYGLLFLTGIFSSFFNPAKNGKLKEMVKDETIKEAMSITSMIESATKIAGPMVSGILVSAMGAPHVFFINAATFFISALLIFFLPKTVKAVVTANENGKKDGSSFKEDIKVGISFIRKSRFLMYGLFLLGFSLLILQMSDSQIIILLRNLTNVSPDLFGYAVACSGIGMLLTGFFLSKKSVYNEFVYMCFGVLGIGLGFGSMAVLTNYDTPMSLMWGPILGLFVGVAAGLVFIPFQAAAQEKTPVHMTGRVFGVISSTTQTATIIGPLAGGGLATIIGIIPSFLITSSLLIILFIISIIVRKNVEEGETIVAESQSSTQTAAPR
ncbi:MFS transporter [Falsibacillus pallidus]|uniref:MFS-type transporter involved in bile tolerance (Atg22 family) n=1 Tax=Falsibacillus pallidus TaxID=493781 RepID=A0A370G2H1_9BACI|nr:MFS transporter [Falsibacillus pallidus]RDI38008.1 MFS-type transporter involved in bile tolerance (Atg22 family) [Falsibacillus pallidus]